MSNISLSERYKVYHAHDPLAMVFPSAENWQADRGSRFTHVATVEASTLEEVFTITNHGATDWTNKPEVVWLAVQFHRSTSVGDVIVSTMSGQSWLVSPRGFSSIPQDL
ncbi:MAG: hypothetical protein E6J34_14945 [Chloroflexi bacterium]|nr:MAG: hypothetical protein E6J34_14945 [Chloroflexota bacterium]